MKAESENAIKQKSPSRQAKRASINEEIKLYLQVQTRQVHTVQLQPDDEQQLLAAFTGCFAVPLTPISINADSINTPIEYFMSLVF